MDFNSVFVGLILIVLSGSVSDARSIAAKQTHKVTKRQAYLWEDECPPLSLPVDNNNTCTDECVTDDYCTGRQMCCPSYGCKKCMEPVLPPPVIDWLGGLNRGYTDVNPDGETDNVIIMTKPNYEEVVCALDGITYTKGVFYRGCRKCSCNIGGYITCELHCKGDKKKIPTDEEVSGSGDEDDESSANPPTREERLNQVYPISYGEDIEEKPVHPKPIHLAFDPSMTKSVQKPDNSGESESGDDEEERFESGEGNVQAMKQRHSINPHRISTHHNEVDEVPKLGDIFLV